MYNTGNAKANNRNGVFSVHQRALVRWDHVLDVDKSVFAAVPLKQFQGLLNEIPDIRILPLAVLDAVANVVVPPAEKVEDGQNLPIIRNERFSDHVAGRHQLLNDVQYSANNVWVTRVEGVLYWHNQLRNNWQNLGASFCKQVLDPFVRQKHVRLLRLAKTVKENREIVVVVEFLRIDFPLNSVATRSTMLHRNGEIAPLVKLAERCGGRVALLQGAGDRRLRLLLRWWLRLGLNGQLGGLCSNLFRNRCHCVADTIRSIRTFTK